MRCTRPWRALPRTISTLDFRGSVPRRHCRQPEVTLAGLTAEVTWVLQGLGAQRVLSSRLPPLGPCPASGSLPTSFTCGLLSSQGLGTDPQPGIRGCLSAELPTWRGGKGGGWGQLWPSIQGALGWEARPWFVLELGKGPCLQPHILPPPPSSLPLLPLTLLLEQGELCQHSASLSRLYPLTSYHLPRAHTDVTSFSLP